MPTIKNKEFYTLELQKTHTLFSNPFKEDQYYIKDENLGQIIRLYNREILTPIAVAYKNDVDTAQDLVIKPYSSTLFTFADVNETITPADLYEQIEEVCYITDEDLRSQTEIITPIFTFKSDKVVINNMNSNIDFLGDLEIFIEKYGLLDKAVVIFNNQRSSYEMLDYLRILKKHKERYGEHFEFTEIIV